MYNCTPKLPQDGPFGGDDPKFGKAATAASASTSAWAGGSGLQHRLMLVGVGTGQGQDVTCEGVGKAG